MILTTPVPIEYVNFGIAGGAKYRLVCRHHPENGYRTKNPWGRSIFVEGMPKEFEPEPVTVKLTVQQQG